MTLDLVSSFAAAKLRVVKFPGCTVLHWRDRESPVPRMGAIDKLLTCGVFSEIPDRSLRETSCLMTWVTRPYRGFC